MPYVPPADAMAVLFYLIGWLGYSLYVEKIAFNRRHIAVIMNDYRLRWMERMLERDNRMADVNIVVSFIRTAMLFVSTSILVLAGCIAVLGQMESLYLVVAKLSFARPALPELMELQVFGLACIFVYAFFKFLWCIRQFNNVLILIGAAPHPGQCDDTLKSQYPVQVARVIGRAMGNFNRGSRAYYFGLGLLPWFVHPWLLAASTVLVILVLYRRDFRSVTLQALEDLRAHH